MMTAFAVLVAATVSASPDELFPSDSPDSVAASFLSEPGREIIRGQSPGGASWRESLAGGWVVESGAIFLHRQDPKRVPLLRDINEVVVATTDQFHFDFEPGWQITAKKQLSELWGAEFRYFQIKDWDASFAAPTTADGIGVVYNGNAPGPSGSIGIFGGGSLISSTASYSSELQNIEANLRLQLTENIVGIVGYRHLSWQDVMTVRQVDANSIAAAKQEIHADNNLDGVQIGADVNLLEWQWVRFDGLVKAGVFRNSASNKLEYTPDPVYAAALAGIGNPYGKTGRESNETSFVGELGLNATFQLTSNLAFRGGYLCLFIDEIAQASDQTIANPTPLGPPLGVGAPARQVDTGSFQILQGIQLSLELSF